LRSRPVAGAPAYLEALWAERVKGLFDAPDAKIVLDWLALNWKRPRVIVVGSGFSRTFTAETARAWIKLSHVCSWADVRGAFLSMAQRTRNDLSLQRELLWSRASLPWEHWSECDLFWDKGGLRLLRAVVQGRDTLLVARIGWLLCSLLDTAPRGELRKLCRAWLKRTDLDLSDDDTLRAAVSLLAALPENAASAPTLMRAAKQKPSLGLVVGVLQPNARPSMRRWANSLLDAWVDRRAWKEKKTWRSLGSRDDVIEAHCLVSVVRRSPERREACLSRLLQLFDASWDTLPAVGEVLHPTYWGHHWSSLLEVLRVGGHARVPKSWLLARIQLVADALNADAHTRTHLINSRDLTFLRSAVIDAIAHGDSVLANNAVYVLPPLARWTKDAAELAAVRTALLAAAEDIRIGVAHGAAFTAGYVHALSEYERLDANLVQVARGMANKFKTDSLAIVRRQAVFGRAKGALHGAQGESG
jgi:hypothetical protein